jgi:protocatechuate 3,4-dioxygenase beta subunit
MHDDDDALSPVLGRRQLLHGATALGILGLARLARRRPVLSTDDPEQELDVSDLIDAAAAQSMCVLTPSAVEGPYYLNLNLVRRDITEGFAGIKTRVNLHVVQASDCAPIPNARVDIWHNNAPGAYSGFANQGTQGMTFLRGVQFTDATGTTFFDSIYPGWYMGRTTHMHLKVQPAASSVLTTQMYFPTGLSRRVYRIPPYLAHGQNPTNNGNDPLFLPETVLTVLGVINGRLQLDLTIGVA